MLRWCQSTLRNVDGYGRRYASIIGRAPPSVPTVAEDTPSFRRSPGNGSKSDSGSDPVIQHGRNIKGSGRFRPASRQRNGMLETLDVSVSPKVPSPTLQEAGLNDNEMYTIQNLSNSAKHASGTPSDTPKVSSVPDPKIATDIVAMLKDVLSRRGEDKRQSIINILSTYDTIPKASKLSSLGETRLTDIISFCGSLASSTRSRFDSPHAPRFKGPLPRLELWNFIARVGAEKTDFGYDLNLKDRYWIMQSLIARVRSPGDGNLYLEMDPLRIQYERFREMSDEPDDHLPYLKFLVSSNKPTYVDDALETLCNLLDRIPDPQPRFPQFLWDTVLSHGQSISDDVKDIISSTIIHRLDIKPRSSNSTFQGVISGPHSTPVVNYSSVIRITDLSMALAASVFPCYNIHSPTPSVSLWAIQQFRLAFSSHLSLDLRWRNTVLLAHSLSSKNFSNEGKPGLPWTHSPNPSNALLGITLSLENVVRESQFIKTVSLSREIQDIARPLWRAFLTSGIVNLPIDITRAFISTFLQIAAHSYDETLTGECCHLMQELDLWNISPTNHWTTKAQAIDVIAAYAEAYIACEGRDWRGLYGIISASLQHSTWQTEFTNILIPRFSLRNVETAYDLYVHALETGIQVSQYVLAGLLSELVKQERWDITSMFLKHPTTSPTNLELILSQSLSLLYNEQRRCVNAAYVRLLAQTAFRLYEHHPPPHSLKYPIRYFLSILARSNNAYGMVKLVQLFYSTVPTFFTERLISGLALHLVHRRDIPNAFRLFRIFDGGSDSPTFRSLEHIRRKMVFRLFKMGAHNAARRLSGRENQIQSLAKRMALVHVGLSTSPSPTMHHRHIQQIASRAESDGPTIREAISLLLRAKHPLSAWTLYVKSRSKLDLKTNTVIGNMFIHNPMNHKEFRYARLVRRVVKTKDTLVKTHGFAPDRATLNIIIKSLLKWTNMVDAAKVRRLFDNMIHEGYPAPPEFRREHGVPFGSPHGPFQALSISSLPPNISFARHVRPLYKMFIKAFYVRNDVVAARTVVGILKGIEVLEMREMEKRNKARREGVVKKRLKELKLKGVVRTKM